MLLLLQLDPRDATRLRGHELLAGRQGKASPWIELDALIAQAGIKIVPQDAALYLDVNRFTLTICLL